MSLETAIQPETGAGNPKPPVSDPQDDVLISSTELLKRVPFRHGKLRRLEASGVVPFIRPKGTRDKVYYWPDVRDSLLRYSRGGEA
jgi:hypothetical protein